jgi:hypothetical protein
MSVDTMLQRQKVASVQVTPLKGSAAEAALIRTTLINFKTSPTCYNYRANTQHVRLQQQDNELSH